MGVEELKLEFVFVSGRSGVLELFFHEFYFQGEVVDVAVMVGLGRGGLEGS